MLGSVRRGVFCTYQVANRRLSGTSSVLQIDQFALGSQHTADGRKSAVSAKRPWSLSTLNTTTAIPVAYSGTAVTKDERREFMAVFPDIVRDLTDAGRHLDVPDATKWFAKVLQYNVPGGKNHRGLAVVFAYRMLVPPDQLTPENIRLAQILGWCVEILQAFFLVADDVMDNALTRRGRPCWYRHNNLGLAAVNDCFLLESGLYQLIRKYFSDKSYYTQILDLFHDITLKTSMGQSLDLLYSKFGRKPNFSKFTMDHYSATVKYKGAYYLFHLPVALAMLMAGVKDEEMYRQAKTILLEIGHSFQVQDDFLDCFGDPAVTGKTGTDIQDGKCTWLAVVALQRMTPEQRALFEDSYGSSDPAKIEAVKELYKVLCIPSMFSVYEEETYNLISTHIQQISRGMPHQLFFEFLDKIFRRVC